MSSARKFILPVFFITMFLFMSGIIQLTPAFAQQKEEKVPHRKLLFFRNDERIWIVVPTGTTFVLIYRSDGYSYGWIKCLDGKGRTLAVEPDFEGYVEVTDPVKKPSLRKNRLVVSRYDGEAVGIYTPPNTAYIEVINSRYGYDGMVTVMDKKKRILNRQSGIDIRITDYRIPAAVNK